MRSIIMRSIIMRSIIETGSTFNYHNPIHCYFTVDSNGEVKQLPHKK